MKQLLSFCLLYLVLPLHAALTLPPFFSDHMVLQRDKPITIWGETTPDTPITISLDRQTQTIQSGATGHWKAILPAQPAGGPYTLTIKIPESTRTIEDIYLGDVWVFSGQSNMQVSFDYYLTLPNLPESWRQHFQTTLDTCGREQHVRHYMVATRDRNGQTIRNQAENRWYGNQGEFVRHCNPIAWHFAREVAHKTGVTTAAVRIAWGGQYIERFYNGADIYNYMLKPWGDFPIRGVIWYQGENNLHKDGDRLAYALKLQLLIRDYRRLWHDPQLPFYIVQLPPARYSEQPFNDENSLPLFLEAQRQVLALPHTAMANTSDLGMTNGLHQYQKYDLAIRLANIAFANSYGFTDAIPAGPQFNSFRIEADKIRVEFETFGSTLTTRDGQPPAFFEIMSAGKNQPFLPAQARIEGNSVLLWNESVSKPYDVRFAFREQDLMQVNLTNTENIPAATFWARATNQLHPGLKSE